MKSHFIRFFAMLLSLLLLVGMLSVMTLAAQPEEPTIEELVQETDKYNSDSRSMVRGGDYSVKTEKSSLPAAYNSAALGYWSSIRHQGEYGLCWVHAAIASCETYMIKHGIPVGSGGAPAANDIDLSEYHLAWFAYSDAYDALGMLAGDKTTCTSDLGYFNAGGNSRMTSFTLMRWTGLASEQTPALAYANVSPNGLSSEYAYQYNVAHVQDCIWINTADRDAVKAAVMEYGAGSISYYHDDAYGSGKGAYFYNGEHDVNHDAAIIGWDDNYSKENFTGKAKPANDGAWIVKNSWHTNIGDGGYFYISYEDTTSLKGISTFYAVESVDNYEKNYQYDGTNGHFIFSVVNGESVANIFTAKDEEQLLAVALSNEDAGLEYTLKIYKGVKDDPATGTLVATQSGVFPYAGYHTVKLDKPVDLQAGERFAVAFTLNNPSSDKARIGISTSGKIDGWLNWNNAAEEGTTYWWTYQNNAWNDLNTLNMGPINFRIKAYTGCAHTNTSKQTVTEPNCTETGSEQTLCNDCGKVLSVTTIAALGHAWDDGVVTVEPTETKEGVKTFTCTRCKETKTERIPALNHTHSYTATVTAPTCTDKGYTTHTCECGDSYKDTYVDALGHAYGEWTQTKAPTCTEKGEEKHACSRCDASETREIAALGHDYKDGVCTRCGEKDPNAAPPVAYADVSEKAWYYDAVQYATRNGLMNGVGGNKFDPNGGMTRAMLVTVLWRYEGQPMGYENKFTDVNAKSGSWYIDAVAWAAENGIVNGIGSNKFDPNGKITREQMAAILFRYANKKGIDTSKRGNLNTFPDANNVSAWAKDAVQWTVAEGIINGSDGKLLPKGNATRAQVATILMRFIENIVKE